ncbi:MAG: methyltransferase domain-containing protein [Planctomycetaceae bacterium]|jgi:ubiquinone/menaquinone biosynthesis C-methylase UbiE|nr:methyltransferase domain-containing protein [Planctomycetaceae bacterium]MBT6155703.1 methyltransferase domain-containing protein [Planctomycetaceae bacterium]MBT6484986.1 methyltransferase domain-containing protein [Planctomycetaceae bacterium]MBT6497528.1 methyltransferase domain-containing protein [Planctomycetaceae bacterium]
MPVDYDAISSAYASSRSANRGVVDELLAHVTLGTESKVLEVGCGTADHIAALIDACGCNGWGVEPSAGMRGHAPTIDRLQLVAGTAEAIPFAAGFFDFIFTVNVAHHMQDVAAYFREAKRVLKPDGTLCTVTESTEMIRNRNPLSHYWPATIEPELARYPTVETLLNAMQQAGFSDPASHNIGTPVAIADSNAYRQKAYSSLLLISDAEFETGLKQLESDLQSGPVAGNSEYVCIWGTV